MVRSLLSIIIMVLFLTGCTMAPRYTRPEAPIPEDWPSGDAYKESEAMTEAPVAQELEWQEFFTDERLQKVIAMALQNSRDLRIAALNVERARAVYGIQRAQLWPTVDAVGTMSKERVPADLSDSGRAKITDYYSVNLGVLSWEIDLFGRLRSLKDQALEEYLATEHVRRGTKISLIAAVAEVYLALAADREALKLSQSTLVAQQASYDLIQQRYKVGVTTELDLRRAQTQVDIARRDVALYMQMAAQDENALNLLVGVPVPKELLPPDLDSVAPPKEISPGISSDVLLSRPDILATEHQLKAVNASIGAARAAFFPRISLTSTIGTASYELSRLFEAGSSTWLFAPQATMPVFDTRLWSALRGVTVEREIAVAQYEKAIQMAFKEVADALAKYGTVGDQLAAQESLVQASADAYRLSDARYTKGIDSYLSVLDAQRSLFAAQQALIIIRLSRITNLVTLYKALGGGDDSSYGSSE
ncbi:MAG: Outer membrane protein OprM precursor [Syntrophorhabdus sp. PtaU1.Bin153]|nr:MAG: Outer membrane protein OprM precursor [Syntrophorhabdus sp. PtaU1.Bin153]